VPKKNSNTHAYVANGVVDLLNRRSGIKPGDIAILCRTNAHCSGLAEKLKEVGIRASVGNGKLKETKVCKIALSALRYMNNKRDTLALTELVKILSEKDKQEKWFEDLVINPEKTKKKWHDSYLISPLNEGRKYINNWTPIEALEQAINRINLVHKIKKWENPEMAFSNLDALRGACKKYIQQCHTHRSATTVEGFIKYMNTIEIEQAKGFGENTINILTYHGAKGLEWPWVILTDLDKIKEPDIFGVNIESAEKFDPTDPLANRNIRFWPQPFGYHNNERKKYPPLENKLKDIPVAKQINEKKEHEDKSENKRLLYVGMTRAKDGLVLAMKNTKGILRKEWLDVLEDKEGKPVIEFDSSTEEIICVGKTRICVEPFSYTAQNEEKISVIFDERDYFSHKIETEKNIHVNAKILPSKLDEKSEKYDNEWKVIENFDFRIQINGNPEMNILGNAIHAYFAVDYNNITENMQIKTATRLIKNFGMENIIKPSEIVLSGHNLIKFLDNNYYTYKLYREWPIYMKNEDGQVIQGWIDMLVETEEGYVVIDHKSYPGKDVEEWAKKHVVQLMMYKKAIESVKGKPVIDVLLHLPVSGIVLESVKN
jgi:ATP-dependent exoDNAse (exonuclease V) beta subunit